MVQAEHYFDVAEMGFSPGRLKFEWAEHVSTCSKRNASWVI